MWYIVSESLTHRGNQVTLPPTQRN